jgi:hypothetical protein
MEARVLIGEAGCRAGDVAHGLTDNFDVAHNRILNLRVLLECLNVRQGLDVAGRSRDRLGDVP